MHAKRSYILRIVGLVFLMSLMLGINGFGVNLAAAETSQVLFFEDLKSIFTVAGTPSL